MVAKPLLNGSAALAGSPARPLNGKKRSTSAANLLAMACSTERSKAGAAAARPAAGCCALACCARVACGGPKPTRARPQTGPRPLQRGRRLPTTALLPSPCFPCPQVDDPSKYGVVVMDGDGKVDRFVEKPKVGAGAARMHLRMQKLLESFPQELTTNSCHNSHPQPRPSLRACLPHRPSWVTRSTPASTASTPACCLASSRGPPPSRRR